MKDGYNTPTGCGKVAQPNESSRPHVQNEADENADSGDNRDYTAALQQLLFDTLPDQVALIHADTLTVEIANTAFGGDAAVGKPCHCVSHSSSVPCQGEEHTCPLNEIKKTGQPCVVEHIHFDQQGQLRNIEVRAQPIFDPQGRLVRIVEVARDITEQKLAERELLENRERYLALFETIADGIFVADAETGMIVNANQRAQQMIGRSLEELRTMHQTQLHPPEMIEDVREKFSRFSEISATSTLVEVAVRHADGHDIPVEISHGGRYSLNGKQCHVGVFRDITERKRAEEELRQTTARAVEWAAKAEAATIAKGQFLANMSHEQRTPMNGVLSFATLLGTTRLDPEQKVYVDTIAKSGQALLDLINDVLDISKIEAGKMTLSESAFDLREMMEEVSTLLSVQARLKNLAFSCRVAPELPSFIRGDLVRLRQILVNLIGNAIKFTDHGAVEIIVEQAPATDAVPALPFIRFAVRDTGTGIPAEKIEHLFQTFSQLDDTLSRRHGGSGLGLAISRQLANLMGGRITVSSSPGKGSVFALLFPLKRAAATDHPPTPPPSLDPHPPNRAGRALIVEDNPVNQLALQLLLKKMGVQADVTSNGAEALAALKSTPYDIVFMDMQMPVMDGIEATRRIRATEASGVSYRAPGATGPIARLPIIAMTAHILKDDREKCLSAGMDEFISKPVNVDHLAAILNRHLAASAPRPETNVPREPGAVFAPSVILDREAALNRYLGDEDILNQVLTRFLLDAPVMLDQLQGCVEAGDTPGIVRLAHALKGACANISAEAMRSAAAALEQDVKTGKLANATAHVLILREQLRLLAQHAPPPLNASTKNFSS